MDPIIGPLISAGTSLLGGLFGSQDKANALKVQQQMAAQNIALQKEFAQSGIQWKVADAKAAGIHPLYGLGASTHSFSPVSVGNDPSSPMGEAIGKMGQDIGRAVTVAASAEDRMIALKGAKLSLENQGLQNDVLRMKLASEQARLAQGNPGPGIPTGFSMLPSKSGDPEVKTEEDTRQIMTPFGKKLRIMNTPDAQIYENRYGDIWQEIGGTANLIGDVAVNAYDFAAPYVSRFVRNWERSDFGRRYRAPSSYYYTPY